MKVNEIWVRETQEEEQRFQIYQQNIDTEEAKIREYAENWEYYTSAYLFLAQAGPQYKEKDLTARGFYRTQSQRMEECQKNIEENRKHLMGASEQENQLFTAIAGKDISKIKDIADSGMMRAKFYYACYEAQRGNLQMGRFQECRDKKESPYDAKAEMIILVHDAEELTKELAELKKKIADLTGRSQSTLKEYRDTLKEMRKAKSQIGKLTHKMKDVSGALKKFVKNDLVKTNSSWPDSDFLEMAKNLEKNAELAEMKKNLKTAIETVNVQKTNRESQQHKGRRFLISAASVALVIGSVYFLDNWVADTFEGAKMYIELESKPKLVFQFETAGKMESAEIPEKILFFETEATTEEIFHTGE